MSVSDISLTTSAWTTRKVSSRRWAASFRLPADVPHYLIFQVSWDYDEILETIPGQMREDVMDYRVWTQR
jgi:hypothetical protein